MRVAGFENRTLKKLLRCLKNSKEHVTRKQMWMISTGLEKTEEKRVSKNGCGINMKILL
jgi:hypothetical protein